MRRMLDPKEAGGSLPSTIKFDAEGNRTVGKNLGVDGKLKLKSLVSASNPDGDITKELGGGGGSISLYRHCTRLIGNHGDIISFNLYSTNSAKMKSSDLNTYIGERIACSGYVYDSGMSTFHFANSISSDSGGLYIYSVQADWTERIIAINPSNYRVVDDVIKVS